MSPNSYSYLLFVAAAACCFWTLPASARKWFVLLASLAAYVISEGVNIFIPLSMVAAAAASTWLMVAHPARKHSLSLAGISVILALLGYFKYGDFLMVNLGVLLEAIHPGWVHVQPARQLPLGISFCAFAAIAFILDTSQGRIKRQSALDITTFLSFWPAALAGPILRFRELGPQLAFRKSWDVSLLVRGLDRIIWGLIQKNLIANSLEGWVREGFMPQAVIVNSTLDNWALAIAFGLQIYFDFASYTNLALGAAHLIGITLPENFRFPYHASNPADFWSRWHMSLSRWIRDYLFFPLSTRFRETGVRYYLSLLGVMALVGLWHGAGWGFVAWGVMHASYLIAWRVWQKFSESRPALAASGATRAFWRVFVLAGAAAAWVPFRAGSLGEAAHMLQSMFFGFRFGFSYSVNFYIVVCLVAAFCVVEPYVQRGMRALDQWWEARPVARPLNPMLIRPVLYALGLFLFIVLDDRDARFIYFQF